MTFQCSRKKKIDIERKRRLERISAWFFLIWSHLSYFQGDYTPVDIGEEKGKGWPETRGRIRVFAGYFICNRYASVTYKCRDAARFAVAQQARCKRGWFRVDSGRIQCIESRDEKAFRFLNIFQLKSRSFVTLGSAPRALYTLHPAPSTR